MTVIPAIDVPVASSVMSAAVTTSMNYPWWWRRNYHNCPRRRHSVAVTITPITVVIRRTARMIHAGRKADRNNQHTDKCCYYSCFIHGLLFVDTCLKRTKNRISAKNQPLTIVNIDAPKSYPHPIPQKKQPQPTDMTVFKKLSTSYPHYICG